MLLSLVFMDIGQENACLYGNYNVWEYYAGTVFIWLKFARNLYLDVNVVVVEWKALKYFVFDDG